MLNVCSYRLLTVSVFSSVRAVRVYQATLLHSAVAVRLRHIILGRALLLSNNNVRQTVKSGIYYRLLYRRTAEIPENDKNKSIPRQALSSPS